MRDEGRSKPVQGNDAEVQACLVAVYTNPPIRNILGGLNEQLVLLDVCEFPAVSPSAGPVNVDHAHYTTYPCRFRLNILAGAEQGIRSKVLSVSWIPGRTA